MIDVKVSATVRCRPTFFSERVVNTWNNNYQTVSILLTSLDLSVPLNVLICLVT